METGQDVLSYITENGRCRSSTDTAYASSTFSGGSADPPAVSIDGSGVPKGGRSPDMGTSINRRGIAESRSKRAQWRLIESGDGMMTPEKRSGAASAVFDNGLYIFGGYGGSGRLNDLYRFDFESQRWNRLSTKNAPKPRENNGAVVFGGRMYLFGGYSGEEWLGDFHSLDFHTLEWTEIEAKGPAPTARFGYVSAVTEGGTVLLFGGYDGHSWLNDTHEYSIGRNEWASVACAGTVPSPRSCPCWAEWKGTVYVMGGYDGTHRMNDVFSFDCARRMWNRMHFSGPAPPPRYFHSCVVYDGSLYIFGGYSGSDRLNDFYQVRLDTQEWIPLATQCGPPGRSSLMAQVSHQSLYLFGGYNGQVVLNDFYEYRFESVIVPPSSHTSDLKTMMNNPILGDVTFLIEGQPLIATRSLLAARSDHFRAMLFGGMKESDRNRRDQPIVITDVEYAVFAAIIEYLYVDQIRQDLSYREAVGLLIAAERYCLQRLKSLCEQYIAGIIGNTNAVETLLVANKHGAGDLRELCIEFIIDHESELKGTGQLRQLIHDPSLLYEVYTRSRPCSLSDSPTSFARGLAEHLSAPDA